MKISDVADILNNFPKVLTLLTLFSKCKQIPKTCIITNNCCLYMNFWTCVESRFPLRHAWWGSNFYWMCACWLSGVLKNWQKLGVGSTLLALILERGKLGWFEKSFRWKNAFDNTNGTLEKANDHCSRTITRDSSDKSNYVTCNTVRILFCNRRTIFTVHS